MIKPMIKSMRILLVFFLSFLTLLSCCTILASTIYAESYQIGVVLPLSGAKKKFGTTILQAYQLYADQVNKKGGINGRMLELLIRDTQKDPTITTQVTKELAENPQVLAILGPHYVDEAASAAKVSDEYKIPCISQSLGLSSFLEPSPWTMSLNYSDLFLVENLSAYLRMMMNPKENISILIVRSETEYGITCTESLEKKAPFLNMTIAQVIHFDEGAEGNKCPEDLIQSQLGTDKSYDGIVIFSSGTPAAAIIKQFRSLGISQPIFCTDRASTPVVEALKPAEQKNVFVTVPFSFELGSLDSVTFMESYTANYQASPNVWAALAYDTMGWLCETLKQGEMSRDAIAERLQEYQKPGTFFSGITGKLSFNSDGSAKRSVILVQPEGSKLKPYFKQLKIMDDISLLPSVDEMIQNGEVVRIHDILYFVVQVVYAGIDVYRFNGLDVKERFFEAEGFLWFKWMDYLEEDEIDFVNLNNQDEFNRQMVQEDLTQPIKWRSYRFKGSFNQLFDLHQFPFDSQRLRLTVAPKRQNANQIQLVVDTDSINPQSVTQVFSEEWKFNKRVDYSGTYHLSSTAGNPAYKPGTSNLIFSLYQVDMDFSRNIFSYLITLFLPLGIIIVITLLSALIPLDEFELKLTTLMTALLSILVFHMTQSAELPRIGYLIKADVFFILSYIVLLLITVKTLIMNMKVRQMEEDDLPPIKRLDMMIEVSIALITIAVYAYLYLFF